MMTSNSQMMVKDYQCAECGATYMSEAVDCCDECVGLFFVADEFPAEYKPHPQTAVVPPRVYTITLRVTDPDTDYSKLRWLLEEAGHILNIQETNNV